MQKTVFPLGFMAMLLVITNPGEEAYLRWVVQKVHNASCEQQRSPTCYLIKSVPRSLLEPTLKEYSHRKNFIFFSLYTTEFLGLQESRVGIGGYFF